MNTCFDQGWHVLAKLTVEAGVLICGPRLRDRRWGALELCSQPKRGDLIAFDVSSADLFKPGIHAVIGGCGVTILAYNRRNPALWTGLQSLKTQASQSPWGEIKPSGKPLKRLQKDMRWMAVLPVPRERPADRSSKSQGSSYRSASARLTSSLCRTP